MKQRGLIAIENVFSENSAHESFNLMAQIEPTDARPFIVLYLMACLVLNFSSQPKDALKSVMPEVLEISKAFS